MKSKLCEKLGLRIRELREAKGYKQSAFADIIDMERSNYTRIENGKQRPSDENIEKIAKILGVQIKDLFDFEHKKSKEVLIKSIINELQGFDDKEIEYLYKNMMDIKQLRV